MKLQLLEMISFVVVLCFLSKKYTPGNAEKRNLIGSWTGSGQ